MKGIVFTELIGMVETKFGYDTMKKMIEGANLPNKGIYVSGGTYPHEELVSIVVSLHKLSNIPIPTLLTVYGQHLFPVLAKAYPVFTESSKNPIEFIASVENFIHVEVRKLYPDAELPSFDIIEKKADSIVIHYRSGRKMEDFGYGLMLGCAEHYKMPLEIKYSPVEGAETYTVRFDIRMLTAAEVSKLNENKKPVEVKSQGLWAWIKSLLGFK